MHLGIRDIRCKIARLGPASKPGKWGRDKWGRGNGCDSLQRRNYCTNYCANYCTDRRAERDNPCNSWRNSCCNSFAVANYCNLCPGPTCPGPTSPA